MNVHAKAAEIGKLAVRMTTRGGSGHPSSALSLAHIVTTLFYKQMRFDPRDPWNPTADRIVLSEGHAVPIVYAAYVDQGGVVGTSRDDSRPLTVDDVDTLRELSSPLDGHPNPAESMPLFDAATGSLGQGLSVAAGLGLAARMDGSQRRVYCVIGDGEAREGQIWEAVDFIVDHKLTNVLAIFNANGQGQADYVSAQQSAETLAAKLTAYNMQVVELDGHDPEALLAAYAQFEKTDRPMAIVARTVKGWGVQTLLNGNWHGKPLPEEELEPAYASLDETAAKLAAQVTIESPAAPATAANRVARCDPREASWPSFDEAMERGGVAEALQKKGKLATRRAYGAALQVAGDVLPQVVALDADVSNSTFANMFAKAHPERFFECKIAEQNMVSAAAGLAATGLIPFANSFAKFLSRAYDQVEMANIGRANIKLVGSHAGISLAADGPSQMSLVDVAFFRSLGSVRGDDRVSPLCWSFHPADAVAAYQFTRMMTQVQGMCYMRTHRPDVTPIYKPDQSFELGGLHVVEPGEDMALVSAGYMVHIARQAAGLLAKQGIRAAVIDAYCLPLNADRMVDALRAAGGQALVVEDNYGAGLGSAVAECAARVGGLRVDTLCSQRIPKSARSPEEILDYCGLSAAHTADHAKAMLARQ